MMISPQQLCNNLKQIVSSSLFNNFILVAIILNSILIACVDYRFVDDNYQPRTDGSLRNDAIEKAEIVFTIFFATECLLKSIAFGFVRGKQAYVKDGWNVLDFIIVLASILNFVPGLPNFSVVRGLRVLRPLRSISRLPNLRKIIDVLLGSLGELANAMVLLLFILVCFSLLGLLTWSGLFHYRCRLTPFPVRMPLNCRSIADECWNYFVLDAVTNPEAHRCLPASNDDVMWQSGRRDCIWPIDETDLRVCSETNRGFHSCLSGTSFMGRDINSTTCGSNYDAFGNPRFVDSLEPYNSFPRMQDATFNSAFDYGLTNFNNFPSAFITAFQIVTLEGWSSIMERLIDSWWRTPTIIAFTLLILLGGQIALNILVAVIAKALDRIEIEMTEEAAHNQLNEEATTIEAYTDQLPPEYSMVVIAIHDLVQSNVYKHFILCVIIFNTIILSADHYGISPGFQSVLDTSNFVTTVIFGVDMVMHYIAFGLKKYWSNASTCFDGIIAIISLAELVAVRVDPSGTSKSSISVLRSLRLLRLFKMIKQWSSIHHLLSTIARAASEIRSFGILLVLFIFIYALIGMQLFANRMHFDESGSHISITDPKYETSEVPRSNFDDFFSASLTVFQVLTGENWNEVMYDCWRATSWVAPVYFVFLIAQGVFCCLSLFLAILIRQFDGSDFISNRVAPETECKDGTKAKAKEPKSRAKLAETRWLRFECSKFTLARRKMRTLVESRRFDNILTCAIVISSIILAIDNPLRNPASLLTRTLQALNMTFAVVFIVEFCMKVLAYGLCGYFRDLWNILDFASVIASVMDMLNVTGGSALRLIRLLRVLRPLRMVNRRPELKLVVEALLMSVPSVLNVAVVCAIALLVFAIFGVTFLKVSNLKLFECRPSSPTLLITYCFYLSKGTFYECATSNLTAEQVDLMTHPKSLTEMSNLEQSWLIASDCGVGSSLDPNSIPSSKQICVCMGATWMPRIPHNFDNIWSAFALLFEISTTEGWVDVMNAAIDQRGIDMQPIRGANKAWAIFFICFILVGSFFLLELFVGAIVENFSRLRESRGYGLMTEAQRKWASTQAFVMGIKPERLLRRPEQMLRGRCYDLVMSQWFESFIVVAIAANSISIATLSFDDRQFNSGMVETLNWVFSAVFAVEMLLKITAFGHLYFRLGWNRFDFTIVLGIAAGFVLRLVIEDQNLVASVSTVVSLMRIGRLVRLVRHVKELRTPFNTIIAVIPSILNVGALLLLLFFIYASVGVELYAMIGFHGNGLSQQSNFRSIGNAMQCLMKFSTGEAWNTVMWTMLEKRDDCESDPVYDEASPWCIDEKDYPNCTEINGCEAGYSVFIFFYSFTLIVSYVILNLIVGVVLEGFENSSEGDILTRADLESFVKTWALFDPEASCYIKAADLQAFFTHLEPPLGFGSSEVTYTKDDCISGIGVNKNMEVHILNVASLLAKRIAKEVSHTQLVRSLG